MSVTFTQWAGDVVRRSVEAARRFNPDATIRIFAVGGLLQTALCDGPDLGDEHVMLGDLLVYVDADVRGVVDVEPPHDRLVLKPEGSPPNERP